MKTSIAIKTKQAKAEKVFKNANPGWTPIHPWAEGLKLNPHFREWTLVGKFKAMGPLGNVREVRVNFFRDGVRVF